MEDSTAYAWRAAYRAAILETDPAKMPARIDAAQKALQERLAEIEVYNSERQEIENAQRGLAILQAERADSFEAQ